MSLILTGIVQGMRPVQGTVESGERKGQRWSFLSLEIVDPSRGNVYSCQMRDRDKQFVELVDGGKLKTDLIGHKVKVTILSQTAGKREIEDKVTGDVREIIQIRSQITNLRDLGLPEDDE
jgi:hypothetical protein